MVGGGCMPGCAMALMRLFVGRPGRAARPMHPHISAFQNWRELAGPGQTGGRADRAGAPQNSRGSGSGERAIWGAGGFMLSSSPHHLRESPSLPIAPLLTLWLHAHPLETFRNPQQNAPTIASNIQDPSVDAFSKIPHEKALDFRTWTRHMTRRHRPLTMQAEKYTGTRLATSGKACGLLYHRSPILSAPLRRHEKPRRRFQGATPGLLPPSAVA